MEQEPVNNTHSKSGQQVPVPCKTDPAVARVMGFLMACIVAMGIYISTMHASQVKTQQRIFDAFIEMSKVRGVDRQNLDTTLPKVNKLIDK